MSNIYHISTQLGRVDSFFLEADNYNDCFNLITEISEAEILNIKKVIYSKKFKIGTNDNIDMFPNEDYGIYKWSFFCYSNNHSKQIDLYNLKSTTTKEDIEKFLKTQLIVDEPIIGFYDDVRVDIKDETILDQNLFQVVYKYNSRTYTENFYSNNVQELKNFFDKFVSGQLIEIREFEYVNVAIKKDDGNYFKRVSFKIYDGNLQMVTFIPNIKKHKDFKVIQNVITETLKFRNKRIDKDKIKFYLK